MKLLLLLPFLLLTSISYSQTAAPAEENKLPVAVVSASWLRDRRSSDSAVQSIGPAAAPTRADKNFERQKRINDPVGMRDPNADTLDTRGSELERIVQQSRQAAPVDGYTYLLRIQNLSAKVIQNVVWEYRFIQVGDDSNVTRRTFMCGGEIKPERQKDLNIFSLVGPSEVVSVKNLSKDSAPKFRAAVVINRVDYADGTFWQRSGWNLDSYKIRIDTKTKAENGTVCRSL